MGKKYLLYARVSPKGSGWDCEETSIDVQFADMRSHCRRIDPDASFLEIADEFKSGKNLKRTGIRTILADLEKRPVGWDCLVVWNLDRLSRSLADALPIFTKLRDAGCEFISVNQEFLSCHGAMGRFMLHQTIAIAELERGMVSERTAAKMRWIAAAGKVPFGKIPVGFVRDPERKNTVVVDAEKAEIVRTVFDLYNSGRLSWNPINERWPGVFRSRTSLYNVLRNPLYIGELHYAGKVYQAESPAIIERSVFEQAQKLLGENKRKNYTRRCGENKRDFLLSGVVKCHCGNYMTGYSVAGRSGGKFYYYKCTDPACKNAINADALEAGVLQQAVQVYTDEAEIRKSLEAYLAAERQKNEKIRLRLDDLEKQFREAVEKEDRIKQMFLTGVVTKENSAFWNAELLSARSIREQVEKEKAAVSAPPEYDFDQIFPELLKAAKEWAKRCLFGEADNQTKRNLLLSMIENLQCTERTEKQIKFQLKMIMTSGKEWLPGLHLVITSFLSFDCGFRGPFRSIKSA